MDDPVDAQHTILNISVASGLRAVAPDHDLIRPAVLGLDDLAADGSRGLLAPAVPGAVRAVDVMEAGGKSLHASFGPVFLAEHLGKQFLPAVAALGHGGIGIRFLERPHIRILLERRVVHAGRGSKEIAVHPGLVGGFEHMGVDQGRAHALNAEALDETHAAHIGRQVIDLDRVLHGALAGIAVAEVEAQVFDAGDALVPVAQRLLVHGADAGVTQVMEVPHQRPADKSSSTSNDDQIIVTEITLNRACLVIAHSFWFS